ncbi:hypothetical protein J007_05207 [Cryptococcus neoformans]|nr:hypothetical protein J007_05207 [Cryptococcus neoformans var. grubii]
MIMEGNTWNSGWISKPCFEEFITLVAMCNSVKNVWSQEGSKGSLASGGACQIKVLEGTEPVKLMRREIALTKAPLKHEMITINVDWNAIE